MTASIWTAYAERRPTKEDADAHDKVLIIFSDRSALMYRWDFDPISKGAVWARTADVLAATGYVKPRKLHSAWKPVSEANWNGIKSIWWLPNENLPPSVFRATAAEMREDRRGFWQLYPHQTPPVWEDEE